MSQEITLPLDLVEKLAHALNRIRNTRNVTPAGESSYELATQFEKAVKAAKPLPNGFASWQETHYEVSAAVGEAVASSDEHEPEFQNVATREQAANGHGGIYELAERLTDQFETKHEGRAWDGEFYDEIEEFLRVELNRPEEGGNE